MANRAYLVGSSNADSAGPGEKGINYNPDTEILCGASTQIPLFWLSLFEEAHIKPHLVQEYRIPAPVCEASVARQLLQQRLPSFGDMSTCWFLLDPVDSAVFRGSIWIVELNPESGRDGVLNLDPTRFAWLQYL